MVKIISERKTVWHRHVTHDFSLKEDPNIGFSFPLEEELPEEAKANYEMCLAHPEMYEDEGVEDRGHYYTEPAVGICECKNRIVLEDQYLGASQCPYCGQWHNLFGQALVDPEYWEDTDC